MENLTLTPPITIRQSDDSDDFELWRLAELDSARPLEGAALIAEFAGVPVAAVELDGNRAIADPFQPTEGVVSLLRTWADELRAA